ncbi:hypothetical protein A9Q81_11600 [Gammaproteobacteria bacterium 42_54_T18]|nr:hypothetical protein A9Q81_11600 [Gammaproteobacteria bacterium 42_54_T18]
MRIQSELDRLEREKDIKILLAVESGNRARGGASPDSDYDVRFLYMHTTDWYLGVSERRDVVEMPLGSEVRVLVDTLLAEKAVSIEV